MNLRARSLQVYDKTETAERFSETGGFAPQRKKRLLEVTRDILLVLAPEQSRLLELGAGTGDLTKKLVAGRHFGEIVVTDGAAAMLNVAKERLCGADIPLHFEVVDFSGRWADRFGVNSFDAAASTLALHHAAEKRPLFRQVYDVLKPGGIWVLGDHMAAETATGRFLIARSRALEWLEKPQAAPSSLEEVMALDAQRQIDEGNNCESLSAYRAALIDCGFEEVECLWQDYWLAVFVALKPR